MNTTAPSAEGQIDLRYVDPADRARIMAAIEKIIATPYVPGTSATLTVKGEFVPVVQSAEFEGAVRRLSSRREAGRPHHAPRRVFRRLRRFRLHGGSRHTDHLRPRAGRRARAHAGGISRTRQHRAARPGAGAGDFAGVNEGAVGWAKRSVPTNSVAADRWWARRKSAFAHPTRLVRGWPGRARP